MFRVPHNIPHVPLLSIHRCGPIGEWVMLWGIENKKKRQYNHSPWKNGWWTDCPYEHERRWVRREGVRVEKKKSLYRLLRQTVGVSFVTKTHYKRFPHHVSHWTLWRNEGLVSLTSLRTRNIGHKIQPTYMTSPLLYRPVHWDGDQYRRTLSQNGSHFFSMRVWSLSACACAE